MAKVTVEVDVSDELAYGEYSNAFRIQADGGDAVLDFIVASELQASARVVARVRCQPNFLRKILACLEQAVSNKEDTLELIETGMGKTVLVRTPDSGEES